MIRKIKNKIRNNRSLSKIYKKFAVIKAEILFKLMDDVKYTKYKYKNIHGEILNLDNPKTFNEKISLLKLNNRNELTTKCTDKYLVREYVKEKIDEDILIPLYDVFDNAKDIKFSKLPDDFVLKANHGSGYTIVCRDKEKLNFKNTVVKMNNWLSLNYYIYSREWNYKNIQPKIVCEKLILDKEGKIPNDFRFFCFDGEPNFIAVDLESLNHDGSKKNHYFRNIYDLNWNLMDFTLGYENDKTIKVEKPLYLDVMIEYSKKLSKDFKHVRVDFYYVDNKIYFGELTFCHAGGVGQKIYSKKASIEIGNLIKL